MTIFLQPHEQSEQPQGYALDEYENDRLRDLRKLVFYIPDDEMPLNE
jgi:hypothetical protein